MSTPPLPPPLPLTFYDRPTDLVARELLGCLVVHRDGEALRIGRVVETEAYLGVRDRAAHSFRGRTPRTAVMFGPPGHAYVFVVYGMHFCLNAVTRPAGQAEAVLVRAVEPLAGCLARGAGPGLASRALGIDKSLDGADLTGPRLFFAPGERPPKAILRGPRVGVDYAGAAWAGRLLRFWEKDSPFVSPAGGTRKRSSQPRGRMV